MSGNPNLQKIGKRKNASAKQQPDWLFPSIDKSAMAPKSQNQDKSKIKQERQLAKDLLKRRAVGESTKAAPTTQFLDLIGAFLSEHEFINTNRTFQSERQSRGQAAERTPKGGPSLDTIYNEWLALKDHKQSMNSEKAANPTNKLQKETKPSKAEKQQKAKAKVLESSSSDSSSEDDSDVEMQDAPPTKKFSSKRSSSSSSSSSASSSSSDSDADDEKETSAVKSISPKTKVKNLKRKASSASDSSSGSESSVEDEAPQTKKLKVEPKVVASSSSSSSDSSSSSSDSESSEEEAVESKKVQKKAPENASSSSGSDSDSSSGNESPKAKKATKAAESSDSDSSSSSDSGSNSDSSTNSLAKKTPLPDSSSESDSDSDSDDELSKKQIVTSDTSATLSDAPKKMSPESLDSSDSSSSSDSGDEPKKGKSSKNSAAESSRALSPPLPPDPALKPAKKSNAPFSRISKDTKVDARLASNAYVPYDYAQKAHEDLIVTKGKGFTKEKNKKKRGSYKGGYIDVEGKKGIKFDD